MLCTHRHPPPPKRLLPLGIGSALWATEGHNEEEHVWCGNRDKEAAPRAAFDHLLYAYAGVASSQQSLDAYPGVVPRARDSVRGTPTDAGLLHSVLRGCVLVA